MRHTSSSDEAATGNSRFLAVSLIAVAAMMSIIGSLGSPLVPTIALDNHVSVSTAQWMLTGALLTGALATPVMGRLADRPGRRRILLVALAIVLTGSVIAAMSVNFPELLVGRALQGVGLGLLPVTMAIARHEFSHQRSTHLIAMLSVTAAIGVGLGYPVTSLIAQVVNYHAAFWFGALAMAVALAVVWIVVPNDNAPHNEHLDVIGALTLDLGVVAALVVLAEGGSWGWTSPLSLTLGVGAITVLAAWVAYELRCENPIVDLRQVRSRAVLTADVSAFIFGVALYLFIPMIVTFVQVPTSSGYGFGQSIFVAGLILVPLSAGTFIASRMVGWFSRLLGVRAMIPLGAVAFAAAAAFFAIEHRYLWEAFVASGIAGVGAGFTYAAMPGFIVRSVPVSETGSATGFYQVVRSLGLSVGSAVATSILARDTLAGATFPSVRGFEVALGASSALCVVVAVVSFVLPGRFTGAASEPSAAALDELMAESGELGASSLMFATEPIEEFEPDL